MANPNNHAEGKKQTRSAKVKKTPAKRRTPRPGHKSIEEIAREQGKELRPWTEEDFARLKRLGKGIFRSRTEFEDFVAGIYERRRQSRGG